MGSRNVFRGVLHASWRDRWTIAGIVCVATWCECQIRWAPLPVLARRFGVRLGGAGDDDVADGLPDLPLWARRRLRLTRRVMRHWPVSGVCLRYSLVAGRQLRALDPELRVGVGKRDGSVVAHAWLVIGGRSLDVFEDAYRELPLELA